MHDPRDTEFSALSVDALVEQLRLRATELGFVGFGISAAVESTGFSDLVRWIDAGYAGQMDYFANRLDAYRHPGGVLEGCRAVICLAYPYPAGPSADVPSGFGRVARYAWPGIDYHDIVHPKLKKLCRMIRRWDPDSSARGVIDTAPILEREYAQRAGLGWRGKNTLLLNKQLGSYFFLACVLADIELPPTEPHESSHCGTCTACLDQCPTDAFVRPGVLDATRCISYLTIEHRGEISPEFHEPIGDWLFGCDVCQQVCPWNQKRSRQVTAPEASSPLQAVSLQEVDQLDEASFRQTYRKTPFWRTRLSGIRRNAKIVRYNGRIGS
ncbi:tRNA epoxyqueuosine(34) reductase QueG [Novipirellula artificiosorum]|uniref:Epoxyqueuosine reductase n=1 Tax=Novipirellula artificiosorum TaxID=2528016 RepID=A0A5C6DKG2_9BACT|nr:tRNA epoxyqueuosine(34) reductase QueG [Novipirellula artificiosorum]TWU36121.1 Epoxyqueuosine reductase [Novipirellula artificiosorum]